MPGHANQIACPESGDAGFEKSAVRLEVSEGKTQYSCRVITRRVCPRVGQDDQG